MGLLSNIAKGFGNFVGGVARGVGNVVGGVAQGVGSVVGGVVSGVGTALGLNSPEKQKQDLQRLQNMSPEKRQELANAAQQLLQKDPNNQLGQTILNTLNQTATPTNTSNAPPNTQNLQLAQLIDLLKTQQEGNEPTKLQGPRVVVQETSQPEILGYFKAATTPFKRPTAVTPRTYEPTPQPKPTPSRDILKKIHDLRNVQQGPIIAKPAPNPLIPKEIPGKVIGKPPSTGPVKPPAEIATKPKKPTIGKPAPNPTVPKEPTKPKPSIQKAIQKVKDVAAANKVQKSTPTLPGKPKKQFERTIAAKPKTTPAPTVRKDIGKPGTPKLPIKPNVRPTISKKPAIPKPTVKPKKPTTRKSTGFLTGIRNFISRLFRR